MFTLFSFFPQIFLQMCLLYFQSGFCWGLANHLQGRWGWVSLWCHQLIEKKKFFLVFSWGFEAIPFKKNQTSWWFGSLISDLLHNQLDEGQKIAWKVKHYLFKKKKSNSIFVLYSVYCISACDSWLIVSHDSHVASGNCHSVMHRLFYAIFDVH